MKYNMKGVFLVFLLGILVCTGVSAVLDVTVESVEVDGKEVYINPTSPLAALFVTAGLEKDDSIEVEVEFTANSDLTDIEVEVELSGDGKKDKVSDSTDEFDIHAGTTYTKDLELDLPQRMDQDRTYQIRVTISNKYDYIIVTGTLDISAAEHALQIKDIVISPENEVKAGRALLVNARIKNRGTQEEEDVKVKVSIPALGLSASDYIDEIDEEDCTTDDCDDSVTSEELYLRIPDCAEPGEYTVRISVEYDDGDEEVTETTKINVVESDTCAITATTPSAGKTIITIGPETQDLAKGGSAMYPVTIANQGAESKVYSISVDSANWAEFSVTPSNVLVVGPSESKAAYVSVDAGEAASGLQVFSVTIKSGETVLKQVPLRANILGGAAAAATSKLKKALEVGLVILVVLLVILGLIIGFNKLKGSEEEEEEKGEDKTYY
ncbi:MAG: hypothetical protein U9O94_10570 [Nanoarchaeota archaeon]|nr:hypothetical protein [Nanoarchaeota archaeon]